MKKKILSLLLAMICLFGAVCPGAALAADDSFDQEKYLEARASHKETNSYKTDVTLSEKEEAWIGSLPYGRRSILIPVTERFLMTCRF